MWLKRWGWVTDRFTVTSDPIQLQKDYNEWLAEEWNSGVQPLDTSETHPTRSASMWWADAGFTAKGFCSSEVRSHAMWLAENWEAALEPFQTTETHPKRIRESYNEWLKSQEALLVGRRMYKSDKLFGKWVKENGFGDIDFRVRSDAMWLAEEWNSVICSTDNNLSFPTEIRRAYNEWLKSQEDSKASPDLPKAEDIKPTKVLTLSVSL
jgi:hypothetical protein